MMLRFDRHRIRAVLTDRQWAQLAVMTAQPYVTLTAETICAETGMTRPVALALMLALAVEGLADNFVHVFHACQTAPVAVRPFSEGFQPTPWRCAGCGRTLGTDDLRYDLVCRPRGPIEFIP